VAEKRIIRFDDGFMIEVAAPPDPATPASSADVQRVGKKLEAAMLEVVKVIKGATAVAKGIEDWSELELEFGVGFTVEGGVLLKASAEGTLKVKVVYKHDAKT